MAEDVIREYLVGLGFEVDSASEGAWTQALNRAGERVRRQHELERQYGRLGVQVVREAIKERETVERALQVTVERGLKERERLGLAVEKALTRAVQEGHRERTRAIRQAEQDQIRSERDREQAIARTHQMMARGLAALTAASSALFYAVKRSVDELSHFHDLSDRTGASVGNIRALQDAYKKVGLNANEAASDVENLASKGRTDFGARGLRQAFGVDLNADPTDQMFQIVDKLKARFGNQGPAGYAVAAQLAEQMGLRENLLERVWNRGPEMRAELERSLQVRQDQNKRAEDAKEVENAFSAVLRKAKEQFEELTSKSGALPRLTAALNELSDSKIPYAAAGFVAAGAALTVLATVASFSTLRLLSRALLSGTLLGGAGRAVGGATAGAAAGAGAAFLGTMLRGLGLGALVGGVAAGTGALLEKVVPSQQHDLVREGPDLLRRQQERKRTKSFWDFLFGPEVGLGGAVIGSAQAAEPQSSLKRIEEHTKETTEAIKELGKSAERKGLLETLFGGGGGIGMGGAGGTAGIAGGGGIDTGGAGATGGSAAIRGRAGLGRVGDVTQPGQGHAAPKQERIAHARQYALSKGLDPDAVVGTMAGEGLNKFTGDPDARGTPTSFGDFQLHVPGVGRNTAGGMGQGATAAGIDIRDPKQWKRMNEYAIDRMAEFAKRGSAALRGQWHGMPGWAAERLASGRISSGVETAGSGAGANLPGMGADNRLIEIMNKAAGGLPPGYTLEQTSGLRHRGHGFHPKGLAADFQILDPQGKPIRNRGEDVTGLYTRLAEAAKGAQEKLYPNLSGRLAWGGAFGTSRRNPNEKDLMHFDLGGERGRFTGNRLSSLLGISPAAAADRVEMMRAPSVPIAPAPSVTTNTTKSNDVKMDNDVNITVHGNADADMIAAGVSRKQRQWGDDLMRRLEGSVR